MFSVKQNIVQPNKLQDSWLEQEIEVCIKI